MVGKNVNRKATDRAVPAVQMAVSEILSMKTGKTYDARKYISRFTYGQLVEKRREAIEGLQSKKPRYACSKCAVPLYLVATPEKRFFWRHEIEDGSCPAVTRHPLSMDEINERKYRGLPEGFRHKKCKQLIEQCLKLDARFANILVEKTWRSTKDPKTLKRPDVSATRGDLRLVFEIQLSTTFLIVVAKRRLFYKSEGALLCWIFDEFDPHNKRMTHDDILFSNNSNVFVVDQETAAASEKASEFLIRVHYLRYYRRDHKVAEDWVTQICRFADLKFDLDKQQIFLVDSDADRLAIETELESEKQRLNDELQELAQAEQLENEKREAALIADKKEEFRVLLLSLIKTDLQSIPPLERIDFWQGLVEQASRYGLVLEDNNHPSSKLRMMVLALLSAKAGHSVGWNFSNFQQVHNHVADVGTFAYPTFMKALKLSGHLRVLEDTAPTAKWRLKKKELIDRYSTRDPELLVPENLAMVIAFLFPEFPAPRSEY